MLNVFLCAYWPLVCLLWRNVYLDLLLIFFCMFVLLLNCMNNLYILEIKLISVTSCANIFSQSIGFLSFYLWFSLLYKSICLIRSHLFIFAFISIALEGERYSTLIKNFKLNNKTHCFT